MTNRAGRSRALLVKGACLPKRKEFSEAHGSKSGPASEPRGRQSFWGSAGSRRELRPANFWAACGRPSPRMPTGESSRLALQGMSRGSGTSSPRSPAFLVGFVHGARTTGRARRASISE